MKLSQIKPEQVFEYNGEHYVIDPNGRNGGGKLAVKENSDDGYYPSMLSTITEVTLVEAPPEEELKYIFLEDDDHVESTTMRDIGKVWEKPEPEKEEPPVQVDDWKPYKGYVHPTNTHLGQQR